jgi:hypothetical protein
MRCSELAGRGHETIATRTDWRTGQLPRKPREQGHDQPGPGLALGTNGPADQEQQRCGHADKANAPRAKNFDVHVSLVAAIDSMLPAIPTPHTLPHDHGVLESGVVTTVLLLMLVANSLRRRRTAAHWAA